MEKEWAPSFLDTPPILSVKGFRSSPAHPPSAGLLVKAFFNPHHQTRIKNLSWGGDGVATCPFVTRADEGGLGWEK